MRITGGVHRSRTLRAPRGMATRPTTDRVREALFSILASRGAVEGARVLDLYAGTGALGLEALSRGAAEATFVESARDALDALRENVAALGLGSQARVIAGKVERASLDAGPYDLVLVDPPYAEVSRSVPAVLEALVARLAPSATIVLEHGKKDAAPLIRGLELEDSRRYGDSVLSIYVAPSPNGTPNRTRGASLSDNGREGSSLE
jgi:16S rRNA (guanine(966)-N(2))-methyltransferase RsmD